MQFAGVDDALGIDPKPPTVAGVYVFLQGEENRIMYVGQAHSLEAVLYRYQKNAGRKKMRERAKNGEIDHVAWLECESRMTPTGLEQLLIRRYQPPWNTQHNPFPNSEANAIPLTDDQERWVESCGATLDRTLPELMQN